MRLTPASLVLLVVGAGPLLVSCGADTVRGGGGRSQPVLDLALPGGGDDGGARWDPDAGIDPGGPPPDDNCHEEHFVPKKVGDPDILLVQDVSGSMSDGMPSKYSQVSGAVGDVISQLEAAKSPIQFGLLFFPNDGACGVAKVPEVPVGPAQGASISKALKGNSPNGNTPLAAAITNGTAYYGGVKDNRGHYFLVATDGEPNCDNGGGLPKTCMSDKDCAAGETCQVLPFIGGICVAGGKNNSATMAIAAAKQKGIKTFVVGIDLGGDSVTLNAMADAGGTARPGNTKYYPVTDQMQLEAAFKNITAQIISCSFALQSLPQMNQMTEVIANGMKVARDQTHMNGWDIDPKTNTLTLYGMACDALQANPGQVSIGYTCPPPG